MRRGRPSIPPERFLSAFLLQISYGVRSERLLMEQLLRPGCHWFVGLADDPVVGRHDLYQTATIAARRHLPEGHDPAARPSAGQALLSDDTSGGRHADWGVGEAGRRFRQASPGGMTSGGITEELRPMDDSDTTENQLPRPAAKERHRCHRHRSGRSALTKPPVARRNSPIWARHHGEPAGGVAAK